MLDISAAFRFEDKSRHPRLDYLTESSTAKRATAYRRAGVGAKSYQPRDNEKWPPPDDPGNPTVNFHGEERSNRTHESKTDPEPLLARKGPSQEAKLSYSGNLLIENRNGLIVLSAVWEATGTAERWRR